MVPSDIISGFVRQLLQTTKIDPWDGALLSSVLPFHGYSTLSVA